jgi:hypothetical protein
VGGVKRGEFVSGPEVNLNGLWAALLADRSGENRESYKRAMVLTVTVAKIRRELRGTEHDGLVDRLLAENGLHLTAEVAWLVDDEAGQ